MTERLAMVSRGVRLDNVLFCPRKNAEVLAVDSCCYYSGRNKDCEGCVYDVEVVKTHLFLFLVERMQKQARSLET